MQIRYSSELFRMPTFEEVQQNLIFLNTGQSQIPGLIVMKLDANGYPYEGYKHILVVFNATNSSVTFTDSRLQGQPLYLHPVQQRSDAADMLKRRLKQAGLPAHYSPHSFRATGITNFLENDGTLEAAQRIAVHADSRTTKLYDRRGQKVLLEDMERIRY